MNPTVYGLTSDEAQIDSETVQIGDKASAGTVVEIYNEGSKVSICYSRKYGECDRCTRTGCYFSGYNKEG